jgi:hypothetical protein
LGRIVAMRRLVLTMLALTVVLTFIPTVAVVSPVATVAVVVASVAAMSVMFVPAGRDKVGRHELHPALSGNGRQPTR